MSGARAYFSIFIIATFLSSHSHWLVAIITSINYESGGLDEQTELLMTETLLLIFYL